MGATVAQSVTAAATSSATALTTPSRTTAASGSLFVILSVWQRAGADAVRPTFTDSKGNVYTSPGSPVFVTQGGFTSGLCMAYCANAVGGAGHTFTQSKANQFGTMVVLEITDYDTDTPIESLVGGNDTESPWLSPEVVATVADALIIAAIQAGDCAGYSAESPSTIIANLGYPSAVTYWGMAVERYAQAVAGGITPGFSGSGGFLSSVIAFAVRPAPPSGNGGSGDVTTDAATASGSGKASDVGSGAVTTDAATATGSGKASNLGAGEVVTADASAAGAGAATNTGAGAATTDDATASGVAVASNVGDGNVVTDDAIAVGTGTSDNTLHGDGSVTTADASVVAAGKASNVATGAVTTADASVIASGKQPIDSESSVKLLIPAQIRRIIVPARKNRLVMPKSVN